MHRDGCFCRLILGIFCVIWCLGSKGSVILLFLNCTGSWKRKVQGCDIHQNSSFPLEPLVNLSLINLTMRCYRQKESDFSMKHPGKPLPQTLTECLFCAQKSGKSQQKTKSYAPCPRGAYYVARDSSLSENKDFAYAQLRLFCCCYCSFSIRKYIKF